MNRILYFMLLLCLPSAACAQAGKWVTVSGKLTETQRYCGGAAPSREMLDEIEKPRPLAGAEVAVKSGRANGEKGRIVARAVTAEDGSFSLRLRPGVYCLVAGEKARPFTRPANDEWRYWDEACLRQRWSACDQVLTVGRKPVSGVQVNIQRQCEFDAPCLKYSGPLPH